MNNGVQIPIIVIAGATGAGKTAWALQLAENFPVEVVSADSRQVYRGMDIGTAKVTAAEQRQVRHHVIDVADPQHNFTVAEFTELAHHAIRDIVRRGKIAVVVGGTGLYIRALTDGLIDAPSEDADLRKELLAQEQHNPGELYRQLLNVDSLLAQRLHQRDITRIVRGLEVYRLCGKPLSQLQQEHGFREQPYRVLKIAPAWDRSELYQRIDQRVEVMLAAGLIDETSLLLSRGYGRDLKAMRTIGYRQACAYLHDEISRDEAVAWIQRDSRRYAKRQLTWFRRDEEIIWVDYHDRFDTITRLIDEFYFNEE